MNLSIASVLLILLLVCVPSVSLLVARQDNSQQESAEQASPAQMVFQILNKDGQPVEDFDSYIYVWPRLGGLMQPMSNPGETPNEIGFPYQQLFYSLNQAVIDEQELKTVKKSVLVIMAREINQAAIWKFDGLKNAAPDPGKLKVHLRECRTLTGKVVDFDTRQPISDAKVLLWGRVDDMPILFSHVPAAVTDSKGEFQMPLVPDGMETYLRVEKAGYQKLEGLGRRVDAQSDHNVLLETVPVLLTSKVILPEISDLDPMESVQQLAKSYETAKQELRQRASEATTQIEREIQFAYYNPNPGYLKAMKKIADTHPRTEAELVALIWCCKCSIHTSEDSEERSRQRSEFSDRLMKNYSNRPEIIDCLDTLVFGQSDRLETCRRLFYENPNPIVKANVLRIEAEIIDRKLDADDRIRDQYLLGGRKVISGERIGSGGRRTPFRIEMLEQAERREIEQEQLERLEKIISTYGELPHFHDGNLATWATIRKHKLLNLRIGSKAQEISGKLCNGDDFRLSELDGKVKVVFFWGSWCGPCHGMLPELNRLAEEYPDQVSVIGVMSETDKDSALKDIEEYQVMFPNIIEFSNTNDRISSQTNHVRWAVNSWPTLFIIDQENQIRFNKFTVRSGSDELFRRVDRLLKQVE